MSSAPSNSGTVGYAAPGAPNMAPPPPQQQYQQQAVVTPHTSPSGAESVRIYVFSVDQGWMLPPLPLASVDSVGGGLKAAVAQHSGVAPQHQILLDAAGGVISSSTCVGSMRAGSSSDPVFLYDFAAISRTGSSGDGGGGGSSNSAHSLLQPVCSRVQSAPPQPLPDLGQAVQQHEAAASAFFKSAEEHVYFANTVVVAVHTQIRGVLAARVNVEAHITKLQSECQALLAAQRAAFDEDKPIIDAMPAALDVMAKTLLPARIGPKARHGRGGAPKSVGSESGDGPAAAAAAAATATTTTGAGTERSGWRRGSASEQGASGGAIGGGEGGGNGSNTADSDRGSRRPTPSGLAVPDDSRAAMGRSTPTTTASPSWSSDMIRDGDASADDVDAHLLTPLSDMLLTGLRRDELVKMTAACAQRYEQIAQHGDAFETQARKIQDVFDHELGSTGSAGGSDLQLDPRLEQLLAKVTAICAEQQAAATHIANQCAECRVTDDRTRVIAMATQHVEAGQALVDRAKAMSALNDELSHIKVQFATEVFRQLRAVMKLQSLVKYVRRDHPAQVYLEATNKARRSCATLRFALRMPHACGRALVEIDRRREFSSKYTKLAQQAATLLSDLRRKEISVRQQFYVAHGQFLPNWPAFQALNDYPHTCVMAPRPFDTGLPELSPSVVARATQSVDHALAESGIAERFFPQWGCEGPGADGIDANVDASQESGFGDMFAEVDTEVVTALQDQLLILHCECELLETECDLLRQKLAAAEAPRSGNSSIDSTAAEAEATAAREHAMLAESKANALQVQVGPLRATVNDLQGQLEELRQSLSQAQQANEELEIERDQAKALHNQADARRKALQDEHEAALERIAQLEQAATEAESASVEGLGILESSATDISGSGIGCASSGAMGGSVAGALSGRGTGTGGSDNAETTTFIKPGEMLAITKFDKGDLALFLPLQGRSRLITLNKGTPNVLHVLSDKSMTSMGTKAKAKSGVVGRIVDLREKVAESPNDLRLQAGTRYFEVDAVRVVKGVTPASE